jgi:hypothetical protein
MNALRGKQAEATLTFAKDFAEALFKLKQAVEKDLPLQMSREEAKALFVGIGHVRNHAAAMERKSVAAVEAAEALFSALGKEDREKMGGVPDERAGTGD